MEEVPYKLKALSEFYKHCPYRSKDISWISYILQTLYIFDIFDNINLRKQIVFWDSIKLIKIYLLIGFYPNRARNHWVTKIPSGGSHVNEPFLSRYRGIIVMSKITNWTPTIFNDCFQRIEALLLRQRLRKEYLSSVFTKNNDEWCSWSLVRLTRQPVDDML